MNIKELDKKLQFEFLNKHHAAAKKAEQAKAALNSVPAYQKICALEKQLIFEVAKNKFNKKIDSETVQNLKLVREQKQKLIDKLGIKKSDLEPKYECKKCQDFGFVGSVMCDCYKARRNEELLKLGGYNFSALPTFEKFDTK